MPGMAGRSTGGPFASGAGGAAGAAAKVERAIRDGDASVTGLLAGMEAVLIPQVDLIRAALAATEPAPALSRGPFDADAAASAVARLKALLEANDGEAADAVDNVAEALAGVAAPERIAALRAAVEDFDFERAAAELGELSAAR